MAFGWADFAADELRHVLPDEVARHFDWSTLLLQFGRFVPEDRLDHQTDLLFRIQTCNLDENGAAHGIGERANPETARWHRGHAYIYMVLLHEQQSRQVPLDLLRSMLSIWQRDIAEHGPEEHGNCLRLPPIVPVVLSRGNSPVRVDPDLEACIDFAPEALSVIQPYVPTFHWLVDDLTSQSSQELKARSVAPFLKLALFCLGRSQEPSFLQELTGWGAEFEMVFSETGGRPRGRDAAALPALGMRRARRQDRRCARTRSRHPRQRNVLERRQRSHAGRLELAARNLKIVP